jgi:hypothetical protein
MAQKQGAAVLQFVHGRSSRGLELLSRKQRWLAASGPTLFSHAKRGRAKDLANAIKGGFLVGGLLKVSSPLP